MNEKTRRPTISFERLREKIESVTTNIAIYTDHLNRYKKELREGYDLTINQAEGRLEEIEKEQRALTRKQRKLHREASAILDEMEEEDDS